MELEEGDGFSMLYYSFQQELSTHLIHINF